MLELHLDQILAQALLLLGLWYFLKTTVFDRLESNLAARADRSTGALAEAKRLREEAAELTTRHEQALAEIRREGARVRDEIRRDAEAQEHALVDAARDEASRTLTDLRARAAAELDAARVELDREAEALAEKVVATILEKR